MQLPPTLRHVLETCATGFPRKELESAYSAISERYRRLEKNNTLLGITSQTEAVAYGATRFPATYSAISRALYALGQGLPDFAPVSVLDVGAGPATATLAALEKYESLQNLMLLELNPYLLALGQKLLQETHQELKPQWQNAEVTTHTMDGQYDLVLCGYVLNEIEQEKGKEAVEAMVRKLWQATKGVLLIVEPGTPAGYASLISIRQELIDVGAFIVAPCPHLKPCPLSTQLPEKWCHFSVRVERSKLHREVKKDATLPYEDEKFSYIIASRMQPKNFDHRLVGHPRGTKQVEVDSCMQSGELKHLKIGKSHPQYKIFRRAEWGDKI
jgi:ribosomal protein RSM22 (predicted rRNA methylase)